MQVGMGRTRNVVTTSTLLAILVCGCLGPVIERHVTYQATCARRFTQLVKQGQTTRQEEQEYIQANERAWEVLCEAMGLKTAGLMSAGLLSAGLMSSVQVTETHTSCKQEEAGHESRSESEPGPAKGRAPR